MMLPGPEAQQLATYIGWLMHGVKGGLTAGGLFVLPSLVLLIALSWIYVRFGQVPVVAGILYGIKPAVTAIVLFAAWRIGSRTLKNPWLFAVAIAAFLAIFVLHAPFPYIVLMAGLFGMLGGRLIPHAFNMQTGHGTGGKSYGTALIDDATPTPSHALFSWRRLVVFVVVGLCSGQVPWCSAPRSPVGKEPLPRWAGSSPRPRCSLSVAHTRCCPTSTKARSSITIG
jgi:chromate transporter